MSLNKLIKYNNKRYRNRYILIAIIVIIIILLMVFFIILKNTKKSKAVEQKETDNENMMLTTELKEKEEREKEKKEEEMAKGIIYLTFDDGPSSTVTPQILDILKQKNIKATFFVLHYTDENAKYIKEEKEQGHTIGLHGYTHNYSEVYQSVDACIDNFKKIQQQVKETTGYTANTVRFIGGSSNTVSKKYCEGIMTEATQRVLNEGFRYFDWNIDSDDSGKAKTSADVYNNVVSGIKENRNNVVLMHDFANNEKTVEALPSIIDYGLENGYVFRKITDDTPMLIHTVKN